VLAVRLHEQGGPEVLRLDELPRPAAGAGEVLVAMKAAALNHLDIWVRSGLPGITLPRILGSDGAGVIVAVDAGVDRFAAGDEVVVQPVLFCGRCDACRAGRENRCRQFGIVGERCDGAQAQLVRLKADNAHRKPGHLTFEEAGSFGLVFLTAYQMLVKRARVQAGETVLVLAGSSGLGAAAIQIAADLGARVIATASQGAKTDFARSLGAQAVVDHYAADWPGQVLEIAGEGQVQVVFEHTGAATWEQSIGTLAVGGRLVVCGATTGGDAALDLRSTFRRHLSILGSTMGDLDSFRSVVRGFEERRYRPVVDKVFKLEQIADAHRYLEESRHCGKVVVRIPESKNQGTN